MSAADLDAAAESAWASALATLRAEGEDVDSLLRRAAANLEAWRNVPPLVPDDQWLRAHAEHL